MTDFAAMDARLPGLLDRLTALCREAFGPDLIGVYLHGSAAFGDFCWRTSDIDLLAVTIRPPVPGRKEDFLRGALALDSEMPPKGLEFSLLLEADCRAPVHPIPYLLHFSNQYKDRCRADLSGFAAAMNGRDGDLAGHIAVLLAAGKTLWGKPRSAVFSPPGREAVLDSLLADLFDCVARLEDMPAYAILNLCRTLALVREGRVLSKLQGGAWAASQLPLEFRPAVEEAMDCQRTGRPFFRPIPPNMGPALLRMIAQEV